MLIKNKFSLIYFFWYYQISKKKKKLSLQEIFNETNSEPVSGLVDMRERD